MLLQKKLVLDTVLLEGEDLFAKALNLVLVNYSVSLKLGEFLLVEEAGLWRGHYGCKVDEYLLFEGLDGLKFVIGIIYEI